jgi:hypothetical protein
MSLFLRSCAVAVVVLVMPSTVWAQTERRVREALAASAVSPRLEFRMLLITGAEWKRRLPEDVRREHARLRFSAVQKNRRRDPVGNGIAIGALAGALGGAGLTAIMATQCDGPCDDPSLSTVLVSTVAVGACVGTLIGFMIDRAR